MRLEIRDATLGYGRKPVLTNVCLTLETGETVCILGRNGAGKTTLFKSVLGLLPLLSGQILLNGKDTGKWQRQHFARMVAYVPQAHSLPFPYKVEDVVLFGRTAHLSRFASPDRKDRRIAGECMERLHIAHLKDRIFTQLSGGEQQLVIVARALAQQPSFLVMDEPTSNLDFGNRIKIIRQINDLRNEALGILMATHSPNHVFMCDARVVVVHRGGIWRQGNANEIVNEDMLREVYDVKAHIQHFTGMPQKKFCIPDLGAKTLYDY
jgi:iron complex transport system ATP-binding protein